MTSVLPPFNPQKETVDLERHPANSRAYSSVVLLVDSAAQTRAEICYGLNDQPIALELNSLGFRTRCRSLLPEEDEFKSVCDLLLQLDEPLVYRTSQAGARKGYLVSKDELYTVLEAAQRKEYQDLFLGNFGVQSDTQRRFEYFNSVDVVFSLGRARTLAG